MYTFSCSKCQITYSNDLLRGECPACLSPIRLQMDLEWNPQAEKRSIWRYQSMLPIRNSENIVSLGEGITPLITSRAFSPYSILLKDETRNPTGSMKDRVMSVAFSKAKELGIQRVITISAGGAGIAASAYAARAGVSSTILLPPGVSKERIMAMQVYGSEVIEVQGSFEDCIQIVQSLVAEHGWVEMTTYRRANPYQAEGAKTISYELYEQLGTAPDYIVIPIGGGGTLGGIWRGFQELKQMGLVQKLPRLIGVQNEKFNGIEIALKEGLHTEEELKHLNIDTTVDTVTGAIKHSFVPDGVEVLAAFEDTGGGIQTVSDEEAMEAQSWFAQKEGIFIEPSSSCVIAAMKKMIGKGMISEKETVVLLLTGSGYRELGITADYHYQDIAKRSVKNCFEYLSRKNG